MSEPEEQTDIFTFRNNRYQETISGGLQGLLLNKELIDVTFVCENGVSAKAHKVILGAVSPYFRTIFAENECKHPIVVMPDVKSAHFHAILEFIYSGEVNVRAQETMEFLDTAEMLKIKGLTVMVPEEREEGEIDASITETPAVEEKDPLQGEEIVCSEVSIPMATADSIKPAVVIDGTAILQDGETILADSEGALEPAAEEVVVTEHISSLEPGQLSAEEMAMLSSDAIQEIPVRSQESGPDNSDESETDEGYEKPPELSPTDANIRRSHRMRKRSVRLPSPFMKLPGLRTPADLCIVKQEDSDSDNEIPSDDIPAVSFNVSHTEEVGQEEEDDDEVMRDLDEDGSHGLSRSGNISSSGKDRPGGTEGKRFKCPLCSKSFSYKNHVYRHYKAQHQTKQNKPDLSSVTDREDLKISGMRFCCPKCNKFFPRRGRLEAHMNTAHRKHQTGPKFKETGVVTSSSSAVQRHDCPICSKSFTHSRYLKLHYDAVHRKSTLSVKEQIRLSREDIPKTSTPKIQLGRSIQKDRSSVRATDRVIKCPKCPKSFHKERYLKSHYTVTHLKGGSLSPSKSVSSLDTDGVVRCSECPKVFKKYSYFKQHFTIVHGSSPEDPSHSSENGSAGKYKCPSCSKTFLRPKYVERHFNAVHKGSKSDNLSDSERDDESEDNEEEDEANDIPADDVGVQLLYNTRCFKCNKNFARRSTLKYHIATQHPKDDKFKKSGKGENGEFKCEHCPKTYQHASHLLRHFNNIHGKFSHKMKCKLCGRVVMNLNSLRSHTFICHPGERVDPKDYL